MILRPYSPAKLVAMIGLARQVHRDITNFPKPLGHIAAIAGVVGSVLWMRTKL